ncbi:MAG: DUF2905 domain-containing protein [Gemmatimonadetes bacterium]|nr:DUF2905 domain-containing protein [Gemmatimonadota bacterium]
MISDQFAKSLILLGAIIIAVGVAVYFGRHIPFIGRLPGDIRVERPGFRFYAPITTGILLSLLLSAILYFISRKR